MQDTRTNKLINIRFYCYTVVQNGCSFVLHPVISICNKEIEIINLPNNLRAAYADRDGQVVHRFETDLFRLN